MADSPNLDEMTTTTLRNRGAAKDTKIAKQEAQMPVAAPKDAPPGPAGPAPVPHPVPAKASHGWGHGDSQKQGKLRCSGHGGAHQIGRKK